MTATRLPPPSGRGPSINLTPEQFHQLMIAALEESPRAREIVRQAFLPAFPIQGAAQTANYIPYSTGSGTNLTDSLIYQQANTNYIGIGTTNPSFPLDLNANVFAIGPKMAQQGVSGSMRFRDDSATVRWLFGIPGTVGSTDFFMYNPANGHAPLQIEGGAPSYMLYLNARGCAGIGRKDKLSALTGKAPASFSATGTVAVTSGSATVSGTSTAFTSDVGIGDRVTVAGQTRTVTAVTSDTQLTVDSNFTTTQSSQTITVLKSLLRLDDGSGNAKVVVSDQGSTLFGGPSAKQVSGGPELLSAQDSAANRVVLANWCTSDTTTNARFLLDIQGNHEWAGPNENDQNVLLGWISDGRVALQTSVSGGGLTIKQSADSQPRVALNNDNTGVQFSDGTNNVDASVYRSGSNQLNLQANKVGVNLSSPKFVLHTAASAVALGAPSSPPTDADLNNANISFYLDQTNAKLKVRVKYSDGTLKTATIDLT